MSAARRESRATPQNRLGAQRTINERIALDDFWVYNGVKQKKPHVSGTHLVCFDLLIPNMYFISEFIERRAEFCARKWNLKQKWHFLRLKSLEMKKIIEVGCHSVRLDLLIPNMYFISGFIERRTEFRA